MCSRDLAGGTAHPYRKRTAWQDPVCFRGAPAFFVPCLLLFAGTVTWHLGDGKQSHLTKMASTAFLSGELQGRRLLVFQKIKLGRREKTDYGDILWNVTESLDSPRTLRKVNSTFRRPAGMGLCTKVFSNIQKSMKSFSDVVLPLSLLIPYSKVMPSGII